MSLLENAPVLFSLNRGEFPEVLIHGIVACQKGDKLLSSLEEAKAEFPTRSTLKPWQFLATVGEARTPEQLLGGASHSGQPMHLAILDRLAQEWNVDLSELQCPESYPMDVKEAARLRGTGAHKTSRYHPCAGKHLAFIRTHKLLGGEPGKYMSIESPAHQKLSELLTKLGIKDQKWVSDSCGLPNLVTSISNMLKLWNGLGHTPAGAQFVEMWSRNPLVLGGEERLDSSISTMSDSQLIAKEGADGILCVRDKNKQTPSTILVKILSGYQPTHLAIGLEIALKRFGSQLGSEWQNLRAPLQERIRSQLPKDQALVLRD